MTVFAPYGGDTYSQKLYARLLRANRQQSTLKYAKREALLAAVESFNRWTKYYGVSPRIAYNLIMVESQGQVYATSNKGAYGLMQLKEVVEGEFRWRNRKEPWMKSYKNTNVFQPDYNIHCGLWLLSKLRKDSGGDLNRALRCYILGATAVSDYEFACSYAATIEKGR